MPQAFGPDEVNRGEWTAAPVVVSMTSSSTASAQLGIGVYRIVSDAACQFLQGAVGVVATTSSNYLPANTAFVVKVSDATLNGYIAGITAATGKLYIMRPL